ncbi:MAG: 16S rRNA (adenine(1518)-N(6)/adenine(1519)-N(6))-dimethyltransferase RsmA [Candidatus Nomurabacteria bacterium]|nr:16S rRNA (adenine(1518)-N(6)/adenine(1519)-N(6))-dimethyltransferase RsmA [Candidatus Nomurabacteria bacterium]
MKIHKAKKSLGQNFLKSVPALNAIVNAGEVKDTDTILEIGPGKGALTEKLLEKAGTVIAIEKDKDLLEFLKEKFKTEIENEKLILINEDILEHPLPTSPLAKGEGKYKIIANIPYNITGAILKKFLTAENQPERMVLMVQNEVAKRIVARDGSESILSISVKAYGNPKIIMKVPARYFSPAPKVDSAIIAITDINRDNFKDKKLEDIFWTLVKTGFAHKRKILLSNLKEIARQDLTIIFKSLNISEKVRAEELDLKDWLEIAKKL